MRPPATRRSTKQHGENHASITSVEDGPVDDARVATVCVVGSVNYDFVATCPRLPTPGETVTDGILHRYPGGKGANQALAARRHGSDVALIAAVGADNVADQALELLKRDGVDLGRLTVVNDAPTGIALIAVDAHGQNQIVVTPGANRKLGPYDVDVRGFDAVLCQLEVRMDTVVEAARQAEGLFCINAAPAKLLPQEVLDRSDVIIVNETEHDYLHDQLADYQGLLIVTLGAQGAAAYRNGEVVATTDSPQVEAVDTVGAGDAFCGTLVSALAGGVDIDHALAQACSAGSKAATHEGAQAQL